MRFPRLASSILSSAALLALTSVPVSADAPTEVSAVTGLTRAATEQPLVQKHMNARNYLGQGHGVRALAQSTSNDEGDAPASLDIAATTVRFDRNLITVDVELSAAVDPNTDAGWRGGRMLLGASLMFNDSGWADSALVLGADETGTIQAIAINREGELCPASWQRQDAHLIISTWADCHGRPGAISHSVVHGDFERLINDNDLSAIDVAPNDGFSPTVREPGGYWLLGADGGIFAFGDARFHGSTGNLRLNAPVVAMSAQPNGGGYRFVATDGGIFSYGSAGFHGSMGGKPLNQPVVGMATTRSGKGYWLVARDGGIFAFGDARFHGSMGGTRLNQAIVAMAPTADGNGYWLVAADGGIFAFGSAGFYGSMSGARTSGLITTMAAHPSGGGYYLLSIEGLVYAFGPSSKFLGSPISATWGTSVGLAIDDQGYQITDSTGTVANFGDGYHFGDLGQMGINPNSPIVGMASAGRS